MPTGRGLIYGNVESDDSPIPKTPFRVNDFLGREVDPVGTARRRVRDQGRDHTTATTQLYNQASAPPPPIIKESFRSSSGVIRFTWEISFTPDCLGYNIYSSNVDNHEVATRIDFVSQPGELRPGNTLTWSDPFHESGHLYYWVASINKVGTESVRVSGRTSFFATFPTTTYIEVVAPITVSANTTIPANVTLDFHPGGMFIVDSGVTLTIAGQIRADLRQIFSGAGTVAFTAVGLGAGYYNGIVYPEWWGAIPDYSTDCAPAIMKAINSGARKILFSGGIYGFRTPVTMLVQNFICEGNSRVYTDLVPLQADISSGSAPNAMFVCANNALNATFRNLRFTTYGTAFSGWAFSAIEGGAGGQQAMFSTIFDSIWVSMGTPNPGFFTGGLADSWITNSEFELTSTSWNLNGAGISFSGWFNNNCHSNSGPFIISTASNVMQVVGLRIQTQQQAVAIQVTDGTNWTFDDIYFDYNTTAGTDGGLASFTTSTGIIFSNFKAENNGGDMSGFLINGSQVKLVHGYITGARTTAAQTGTIKLTGLVDVDIDDVSIYDDGQAQITFDTASGEVRIRGINANRGAFQILAMVGAGATSANIYVSNSSLMNGQYGSANTVALVDLSTSGNVYLKSNIIGTNDASSNPVALFRFLGTGLVVADDNTIIGAEALLQGGSTQEIRWDSGTYAPVVTSLTNLDSSANAVCQYTRSGDMVTVSGRINVDPTAAASTTLAISLPLASNLGAEIDLTGVAYAQNFAEGGAIYGDVANNRAIMEFTATNTGAHYMIFTFSYRIL